MAEDVFRVTVRGAGHAADRMTTLQRGIQDELIREMRQYRDDAVDIIRDEAPEDTGDLRASVRGVFWTRARRPRVRVELGGVEGHGTPHDYTNVVRFGHRQVRIYPQNGPWLAVHTAGHRVGTSIPMRVVRRAYAKVGYPGDFVERSGPALGKRADDMERAVGRRIERRMLR